MAAVTIYGDFGAQENKVSHCFHCFPIYLPWSDGTRCHDLSFLNVSFKPALSFSSFTFIKRLFSSSSLSAIRVVSSTYLKLLIFLQEILIPGCASSSPEFHMMWSEVKIAQSCLTLCHRPETGVGNLSLLQGIFPTQGSNSGLLHCRLDSLDRKSVV